MTEDMTQFLLDQFEIMAEAPGGIQRVRDYIYNLSISGDLTADLRNNHDKIAGSCPKSWEIVTLEDISIKIADGVHKKPNYLNSGIPFLTVRNLTSGPGIDYLNVKYISIEEHLEFIQRTKPEKGDLLITKDGTIGVTKVIKDDIEFSIFVSLALIKPKDSNISDYLQIALSSPKIQASFKKTGSGLKHLVIRDLKKVVIPLPSIEEQRIIVSRFNNLMALCDDLEAKQTQKHTHLVKLGTGSLTALQQSNTQEEMAKWWGHLHDNFGLIFDCVENVEALRQTILELAVRGMLGTRDDKDEPISKVFEGNKDDLVQSVFSVPSNWIWIKLGSVIQSMTNGIYRPATCYIDDGIACLRMYNINGAKLILRI